MPMTAEQRTARAKLAAAKRHHPDAELPTDAAQLASELLDRRIDKLVAAAPKMTPQQVERLRGLFAPLVKAARTQAGASG